MRRDAPDPAGGWNYVLWGLAEDEIDNVMELSPHAVKEAIRARGKDPELVPSVTSLVRRARAIHPRAARHAHLRLPVRERIPWAWVALGIAFLLMVATFTLILHRGSVALQASSPASASAPALSSSSR